MVPLFTLTTDFGAGSGYPAQVKAVLLTAHPAARIVDVSHEVPGFDVLAGALLLEAVLPWFPPHAIHLAVVDPGVGTVRRALCAVDAQGRRLLAPDNGLLTPFLGPGTRVYALSDPAHVPAPASATFHGRDLFAPVAAALAGGLDPARLGPAVADPVRLPWPEALVEGGTVSGVTLAADPFGNLVTSIRGTDLAGRGVAAVEAGGLPVRFVHTFGDGVVGELLALVGSGGRLELAVREGSAAARLGGVRGIPVLVSTRDG